MSTVNGGIELGDRVTVDSVETVNGGIELGEGPGSPRTSKRSTATSRSRTAPTSPARVATSTARIKLDAAHVGGGIETVSGDVEIGANSRVEGGLLVEQPHGWFRKGKKPRIVIGPHAVVDGKLEFRREVDLYVSDTATIGAITGATAKKFTGDHP